MALLFYFNLCKCFSLSWMLQKTKSRKEVLISLATNMPIEVLCCQLLPAIHLH
uniref:Uncharacterized protein n=1 Tax=uncultured Desulfobacterium sp. TaxID=201089 RepID=E1YBP9_9BACT|nr:unknown protein [uncultured Desulfobacterium sp.]